MSTEHVGVDESTVEEPTSMSTSTTGSGLDENVAGALAYLFGLLTGVVFFVVDKENEFVRFHAAQSMVLNVAVIGVYIVFSIVGAILSVLFFGDLFLTGGLLTGLLSLLTFLVGMVLFVGVLALWVYLMYTAYKGKTVKLPIVGGFAERIAK
jgi:uncharacterized membrane protein